MRHSILAIAALAAAAVMCVPPSLASAQSHEYVTSWGELGASGPARFSGPTAADTDYLGNVYVADSGNAKIHKYNNAGGFVSDWGNVGNNTLSSPVDVAVLDDRVYVIDNMLESVFVYDLDGEYVSSWGSEGGGPGEFQRPRGIAAGAEVVYVVDSGNSRIQVFTPDGEHVRTFGNDPNSSAKLRSPVGIAESTNSTVYVSEPERGRIHHYDSEGVLLRVIEGTSAGTAIHARGLAVDSEGKLYAADSRNDRILRLEPDGMTITAWGISGVGPYEFALPSDVAVDLYGHVFVVDLGSQSIKKYSGPLTLEGAEREAARAGAESAFMSRQNPDAAPAPAKPAAPAEAPRATAEPAREPAPPAPRAPARAAAVPGDLTKPTIHAPHDVTVEASGITTSVEIGMATASDESGIISIKSNAPDGFSLGTSTVIWTAVDGAGNMAIDTQQVTVADTILPTIATPPDILIEAVSPDRNYVNIRAPVASDNVGVLDVTTDAPEYFGLGVTAVTWTAHDIVGNTASAVQQVTVVDTTDPQIMAPPDVTDEAASADANDVFLGDPQVTDNGQIESITNDAPEAFAIGETTVTWTATDSSGNTASDTQIVTVVDTTPPSVPDLAEIVIEATSASHNIVELPEPDVRDVQSLTFTNDAPDVFPIGETTVAWTVTDAAGHSSNMTQTVRIVDTTPPEIQIPDAPAYEATSRSDNDVALEDITISDISDISLVSNDAPSSYPLGNTTVVWAVSDVHGNVGTASQSVSVVDTTPPSVFAPADITAEYVGAGGNTVVLGTPVTADLVGVAGTSNDAPASFGLGATQVTWTARDTSGNESTDVQRVTIIDTLPPAISPPPDVDVEASGRGGTAVDIGLASAADESDSVRVENNAPQLFDVGVTIVTWSAIDPSENVATAIQTVVVRDTELPTITPPPDVSAEAASADGNVVQIGKATAEDSVGSITITNDAPDTFGLGTTAVTWTVTDASGNAASATQTVTLYDTVPPSVLAPPDVAAEAASANGTAVDVGEATASDSVGVASLTHDAPALFGLGETVVTWTATDEAGNTATAAHTVRVEDTTPPLIVAPPSLTVEAQTSTTTAADIGAPSYADDVSAVSLTNNAPDEFPLGKTTVMWKAVDAAGNERAASQTITVVDTTPPSITVRDITAEATSSNSTDVPVSTPYVTDAVGVESIAHDAPDSFPLGTTHVTWTATDMSGNTATAIQNITIEDTTPPDLTVPEDITAEATSATLTRLDIGAPSATDLGSESITVANDAPSGFTLGQTQVRWTAIDGSANSVTRVQTVTIVDTVPPVLSAPSDLTLEADSAGGVTASIGYADVEDVNGVSSITNDAPAVFPLGNTTVTWTATDTTGLVSNSTQLVRVVDTVPPIIFAPEDITVESDSTDGVAVDLGEPYASDRVGVASVTNDAPSLYALGTTVVIWEAADAAGNTAVSFQTVNVADTAAPHISPVMNVTANATSPQTQLAIEAPAVFDSVDPEPAIASDAPDSYPLGTTLVTWTATDSEGNTSTAVQSVTVLACGAAHERYNPVTGTPGDDTLSGTDAADLIFGLGGNDVINAAGGNDCVFGGAGADVLLGGPGNDAMDGGEGDDIVRGQRGDDVLVGLIGADILDGGEGTDTCRHDASLGEAALSACEI